MTDAAEITIAGDCTDQFAKVRDAFAANFALNDELGASFSVTLGGEVVVDLHGGWADPARTRAWRADTATRSFKSIDTRAITCEASTAQ